MLGRTRITVVVADGRNRLATMRVTAAAVGSAIVATGLVATVHAAHPAQFVMSTAAGLAFLTALGRRSKPSRSDWLTVRLLLAANLVVFGISEAQELGAAVAAATILSGVTLAATAVRSYLARATAERRWMKR